MLGVLIVSIFNGHYSIKLILCACIDRERDGEDVWVHSLVLVHRKVESV